MRIGFFYKHFNSSGGLPRDYRRLVEEVASLGNEVFVYTYKTQSNDKIDGKTFQVREFLGSNHASFLLPNSLEHLLENNSDKIDILEVVGGFFPENITVSKIAKKSGIPYVYTPLGHLAPNVLSKKSVLKKAFLILFLRKALHNSQAIHCMSEFDKKHCLRWVQKPILISTLGTFIEDIPSKFLTNKVNYQKLNEINNFLYFGRIDYFNKGLDIIVKAVAMMQESRDKIIVNFVGPGSKNELATLENEIRKADIDKNAKILPPIYSEEKYQILSEADFLVLPSRKDNIPRAVREALSVGCPVIVSEETGTADIVTKYKAGFVVRNNPEDLASIMRVVMDQRSQWTMLRAAAQRAALEGFSWTRQGKLLSDGFEKILNSKI